MYQVIEYNDYRKENYIFLHGVTSDLEKAKQRAQEIIQKSCEKKDEKDSFYQIYKLQATEYVDLQPSDKTNVICQYSYRLIECSNLLGKTVREVFEMMDEKVPKKFSPDEIIAKDVFQNLIDNKHVSIHCAEELEFEVDNFSRIIAIVKCDEF